MRDNESIANSARAQIHWLNCHICGEGGLLSRITGYVHPEGNTAYALAAMSDMLAEMKADVDAKRRASISNEREAA